MGPRAGGIRGPSVTAPHTTMMERARRVLRGELRDLPILGYPRDAEVAAFLVTLGRDPGDLVVPVIHGRTVVARGSHGHQKQWPHPPAIEQAQWLIDCEGGVARVSDLMSTNQSVLLPGEKLPEGIDHDRMGFLDLDRVEGATILLHPNKRVEGRVVSEWTWYELAEGSILRTIYATFVFGWL